MSLAPTNEESAWTGKKTSVRKKINLRWERHVSCVDSFRLLTTSVRVMWKVETRLVKFYSKNGVTSLIFKLFNLLLRSTLIVPFV